ncbi:hypothetical protein JCM8547_005942 [Rhodosporidiobolus lusitaniae]
MHSALAVASLAALARLASAQTGYGRFPCTIVNGDNTLSADQTQCADAFLVLPGSGDPTSITQGDQPAPTSPQCQQQIETGAYFCGIAGAACATDANCDNGHCVGGTCQGGLTQGCGGLDTNCLGYLYCQSGDFTNTPSNTCGGFGSFCQDPIAAGPELTAEQAQPIYNQFCGTGYCNAGTGNCDIFVALGGNCAVDPAFGCGPNAFCDTTLATPTCVANPVASGRARARRNEQYGKRNLCPASHSACAVGGGHLGYECVDTANSIEQCGGCAGTSHSQDCSAIVGADAVGCVAGRCEVWSCAEGYTYSAATQSCEL